MKHQHLPLFGAVVLAFQLSSTASAHHSFAAQYDSSKPIQMRGTVTKVEWTNPHARVYIDVRDQISVRGYLARKGERMAIAGAVADASGKPIFESDPDIRP